ncbi:MAG: hypothetical protein EBZ77_05460, partial [Chitinophagia bacterium]|nr:hypothetical protein [Chitinophagia bacterium]
MKKSLQLVALLLLTQLNTLFAQRLFTAPDTVCINQPVHLNSTIFDASSYYWGFCSGSISNPPVGNNMGSSFSFNTPGHIDIVQDKDGMYYGFVVNTASREFLRMNFGFSLNNVPTITNFGDLTHGLPMHPSSIFVIYDTFAKNWFVFVGGGYTPSESSLARIDFGMSLSNPRPNIANFGNLNGTFDGPKGIFVAKEADSKYYGYLVNRYGNDLVKLEFNYNISNTPIATSLGNVGGVLNFPTDMAAIFDQGDWHFFVTNRADNTIARLDMGPSLDGTTIPTGFNYGDFNFRIKSPSSISISRDCGSIYCYITDSVTAQLISLEMPYATFPTPAAVDYSVVGGMNYPSGISTILRDVDSIFAFISNTGDNSLTRLNINSCTRSSIPSFTEVTPPVIYYDTPGLYTVYYVIDQGLPTMQVDCKEIRVLPIPSIA